MYLKHTTWYTACMTDEEFRDGLTKALGDSRESLAQFVKGCSLEVKRLAASDPLRAARLRKLMAGAIEIGNAAPLYKTEPDEDDEDDTIPGIPDIHPAEDEPPTMPDTPNARTKSGERLKADAAVKSNRRTA